jgi:hypothetical protein
MNDETINDLLYISSSLESQDLRLIFIKLLSNLYKTSHLYFLKIIFNFLRIYSDNADNSRMNIKPQDRNITSVKSEEIDIDDKTEEVNIFHHKSYFFLIYKKFSLPFSL